MTGKWTRELFLERFVPKVEFTGYCWLWTGAKVGKPGNYYPALQWKGWPQRAHRLSYAFWNGPLCTGHEVHHTCETQLCVHPDHLEQLSKAVHHEQHKYQFCPQGHELTDNKFGNRCVVCNRIRAREYWRAKHGR